MSDFADRRRPLVERVRAVRGSLRGEGLAVSPETPVEEYERRRFEQGYDGTERLSACLLLWLGTHGVALLLFFGAAPRESWRQWPWWRFLGPGFFGLLSLGCASVAAYFVLRDRGVLRRRWAVAGLLPWVLLVIESTLLLSPVLW